MVQAWLKSVECAGGVCSVECVVSADFSNSNCKSKL